MGVIAGVAAAGVVLAAITGVVAYKKAKRSKQPHATLAAPVPIEMMATQKAAGDSQIEMGAPSLPLPQARQVS